MAMTFFQCCCFGGNLFRVLTWAGQWVAPLIDVEKTTVQSGMSGRFRAKGKHQGADGRDISVEAYAE